MNKLLAVLLTGFCFFGCKHNSYDAIPLVDTHVHFWDVDDPNGIGWPREGHPLYKTIMPRHFEEIAKENNVKAVVIVQSGSRVYENEWTLKISEDKKAMYPGVVGNFNNILGKDEFDELFEKYCRNPRYVGFRIGGNLLEDKNMNDKVWQQLKKVADKGKTLDVLMTDAYVKYVSNVAKKIPNLKIIINHGTGAKFNGQPRPESWVQDLQEVSKHPNVYCKVSGFFDRTIDSPAPKNVEYYKHNLDALWQYFGEDRLIFGSDWPVTKLDGTYAEYKAMIMSYFKPKGFPVCEKIFYKNALKAYGISIVK